MSDAFGATEIMRLEGADGRVGHAEVRIGDSVVMIADAPAPDARRQGMLHLYLEDADATYARAIELGATSKREPTTEFYGDRIADFEDSWGNRWSVATHVEDVSQEEMARIAAQFGGG